MGDKKWQARRHQHAPGLWLSQVDDSAWWRRGVIHRI